jgi:ribonucleoside-triphosphate reductase
MFSTFGTLGLYEATKKYVDKFGNESKADIQAEILIRMNEKVSEMSKKYKIIGNIEQIPAESFAIRLVRADKAIYGEEQIPYTLYSNQFIPLWEKTSIWDKMDEDGKYNSLIPGGGIAHIQIGEPTTPKQNEKIIRYSVNSGCEHFALNSVWCECKNHHAFFGKLNVCPKCGEDIVEYYTRVVGFFTPVSSWTKERCEWEFPKRPFSTISDIVDNYNKKE